LAYDSQRPQIFTGRPKPISIFFSKASPALKAYVQPYRWQDESEDRQLEKAAFTRDYPLSYEAIQDWVERDLEVRCQRQMDFPLAVHQFLMKYTCHGMGLPKHGLVANVHRMACFFRVWKTPSFCCQDSTNKDAVLPISVQAQLRTIVQRGLHSIEHNVLRELDSMITPMGQPRFHDKLPLWACLWQLILIYRELTAASRAWLSRSEQGRSDQLTVAIHTRYKYLFEN